MSEKYNNYLQFLKDRIYGYKGKFDEYIYYTPDFFQILCNLLDESVLSKNEKNMILCALGYFVAPNDVIPEEIYGPAGYIDDIFLCCHVLKHLALQHGIELIEQYWQEENENFGEILESSYKNSKNALGTKAEQVLHYVGLN